METNMDRSLDEILADRKKPGRNGRGRSNNNGGGGSRRRERRDEYPRDGIRKSYRDDPRKIDEEWVHDRYGDDETPRHRQSRNNRASPDRNSIARTGTRVRVENLHYELTREDLEGLFQAIGPVRSVEVVYDRAGRSEGVAFVTYENYNDAKAALAEYDGANAKGQPIHLTIVPAASGGGRRGNPLLDAAIKPGTGRPLAERITRPRGRRGGDDDYEDNTGRLNNNDDDDEERDEVAEAARHGIDRYVPRGGARDRSRSPRPQRRREGGRRPGERRGGRDRDGRGGGGGGGNNNNGTSDGGRGGSRRPRKTAEELDAEMENYFGGGSSNGGGGGEAAAAPEIEDDTDMIG